MTLKELLKFSADMQWTFICFYEDVRDRDYLGKDPDLALEALEACDVMNLIIVDVAGRRMGWVLIVTEPGQDPEEQIADHSSLGRINFMLSNPWL